MRFPQLSDQSKHQSGRIARVALLAIATALTAGLMAAPGQAAQRAKVIAGFNGTVNDMTPPDSNGVTYVAGEFTAINPVATGGGAVIDPQRGIVNRAFPKVSGAVYASAPDGNGGYYIAGSFSSVDGVARTNLAHINSDGSLDDSWDASAGGDVKAIAVSGSAVYIGGDFSTVNGETRNRAAAIGTDGSLLSWNPNLNNTVAAIAVSGSTVYLGGEFTTVGGTTRNRAAAIGTDGSLLSWNPNVNKIVRAIAVSGSTVYIGGDFGTVGGTARKGAAALGTDGTLSSSWHPAINTGSSVFTLAVSGSTVYLGGSFYTVNNSLHSYAVAVGTDGTVSSWDPNVDSWVRSITVSGSTVYLGGLFDTVGGLPRHKAAAVDSNGNPTAWNPNPSALGSVYTIVSGTSNLYLGGDFPSAGGTARNYAAAIASDGTPTPWDPQANGSVAALSIDAETGSTVYFGGYFSTVKGQPRSNAAALGTDGTLSSWAPNADSAVTAIASGLVSDGGPVEWGVYLGGGFTTVNGQNHFTMASVKKDGSVTSWDPQISQGGNVSINSIVAVGTFIYFGGAFDGVLGQEVRNAAIVDAYGNLGTWFPNPDSTVYSLAVKAGQDFDTIYLGGAFNSLGGVPRNRIGAFEYGASAPTDWDPNFDSEANVNSLLLSGGKLYAGGRFTTVGGESRSNLAAFGSDGTLDSWNPGVTTDDPNWPAQVWSIAPAGSKINIGGEFKQVGGANFSKVASIDSTTGVADPRWIGMLSPPLDTSAATIDRGTTIKADAEGGAGSTAGSYRWQRCDSESAADCQDIIGESGTDGAWFGSRNSVLGKRVRLKAVWETLDSTLTAFSAITGVFVPTAVVAPTFDQGLVSGAPKVGSSLHTTFGTWNGYIAGETVVNFQWERCSTSEASSCTTLIGSNSQWYRPVAADAGNYLRVTATMTVRGQTAVTSSAISGRVASKLQARRAHARAAVAAKAIRHNAAAKRKAHKAKHKAQKARSHR
ncbi:MAG: delta-60 repeat domain-containing protein [Actinomycetes bacterium]